MSKRPTTPTPSSYERANASPLSSSRRRNNAWHEVLDLCKNGFTDKMESVSGEIIENIRAEVNLAVSQFRSEASSATIAADRPIGAQLLRMEDNVRRIEKLVTDLPAPSDLAPVHQDLHNVQTACLDACQQLGERLDQLAHTSSQMSDRIQVSESTFVNTLERLDEKINQLDLKVQGSEIRMGGDFSRVQQQVNGATSQIMTEVQRLQQEDEQHFTELGKMCSDAGEMVQKGFGQLTQMSGRISDQINTSGASVSQVLHRIEGVVRHADGKLEEVETMQKSLQDIIAQEVQKVQKQDDRHYTNFCLVMENAMSNQNLHLQDLEQFRNVDFQVVSNDVKKTRIQQQLEFTAVLGELAKVQQALNIDYLKVERPTQTRQHVAEYPADEAEREIMLAELATRTHQKRVREFFTQTHPRDRKESYSQTDPIKIDDGNHHKRKHKTKHRRTEVVVEKKTRHAFGGVEKLKQAAKEASLKPPYNVFDHYWNDGICQQIAKSNVFEQLSLLMVCLNAIWIAVDTDMNNAALLADADIQFVLVENLFCLYFSTEVLIRFMSFQIKRRAAQDAWFVFDFVLVIMMIVETWVVPGIMIAANIRMPENTDIGWLKMVKMVKLVRLSRMARLLRQVPELIIIIKGLRFAARSVGVFFMLWTMIVYVFAILFRQITDETSIGKRYFGSVLDAMNTLLLNGVFADSASLIGNMSASEPWLWPIMIFFMALVSLTLMYMLVGVLVDVVGVVANTEKEGMSVSHIASQLREELRRLGYKEDAEISQSEFVNLMVDAGILKIIQGVGVDVVVLADMLDMVFEQFSKGSPCITFPDLVEVVLSMRGTNPATVKDCKEQIRMTKSIIKESNEELVDNFKREMAKFQNNMAALDTQSESENES